ncbi:MAG: YcxB family protein [Chitinophagaceae bacterium]|nr:MAG: YcxB family protein [Chitinophagaceae bacterium]
MLVLRYSLTYEEYLDYNYFTAWTSPDKAGYRRKYYLQIMALYVTVAGLYIFANRNHGTGIDIAVFSGIGAIYFMLIPTVVRRSIRTRVKGVLAKPENHHVLSESEVTLTDNGILDKDTVSESRYDWDAIVRKSETALCYYLYTNSYHAIVIPKRVVKPSDQEELTTMFNVHLPLSSHQS